MWKNVRLADRNWFRMEADSRSRALKDAGARTLEGVISRTRVKVTGAEGARRHPGVANTEALEVAQREQCDE